MTPVISLRRVRTLIDPEHVAATASALVTGVPIANPHTGPTPTTGSDMPRIWLNDHVFDSAHVKFVPRSKAVLRDCFTHVLPKFIDTDFPVEFNYVSIEYGPDLIHASATLHHADGCEPVRPLRFVNHDGKRFITSTTRTHSSNTEFSLTPNDDTSLDNLVFNPESEVRYKAADPARLLDIATVRHGWGPALDDPVWTDPIPRPGTDIAFDSANPRGIHGGYLLLRNGSNVAMR